MPDFVLMCLMKKCPIYADFFSADKKSTTESTTGNRPQTRNYINREIQEKPNIFLEPIFVRRFGKRNRVTITWETRYYADKYFRHLG